MICSYIYYCITHSIKGGQKMAIIDTLHEAQFVSEFIKHRPEDFSYDGLKVLFQYLDDMSKDTGEDIEFCPVSFCCEFSEYNLEEFNNDYDMNIESFENFDIEKHEDELNENSVRIIEFFTAKLFGDGYFNETEEKVLVHCYG